MSGRSRWRSRMCSAIGQAFSDLLDPRHGRFYRLALVIVNSIAPRRLEHRRLATSGQAHHALDGDRPIRRRLTQPDPQIAADGLGQRVGALQRARQIDADWHTHFAARLFELEKIEADKRTE